jgi:zinc transporter
MDCIQHAFHINGKGKATALPTDNLPIPPKNGDGYLWLHFDRKNENTRQTLIDDEMIDDVATDTLLSEDSRPRTITRGEDVLINLRGVNLNPGAVEEDMIPIRFFVQKNRVISVSGRPLKAVEDALERLQTQTVSERPGGFIAGFALLLSERMAPTITDLNEQVDELEEGLDNVKGETARSQISELRRKAILFRRYIAPQKDALTALSSQSFDWLSADDKLRLRDAADQSARITEDLDAIRERCAIIKDQLTDIRAEQMNKNMMILSVVAAIFLPLGLISGMMGINVGGMPWVETNMGFWYVTALIIGIGIIQLIIFKWLKWL